MRVPIPALACVQPCRVIGARVVRYFRYRASALFRRSPFAPVALLLQQLSDRPRSNKRVVREAPQPAKKPRVTIPPPRPAQPAKKTRVTTPPPSSSSSSSSSAAGVGVKHLSGNLANVTLYIARNHAVFWIASERYATGRPAFGQLQRFHRQLSDNLLNSDPSLGYPNPEFICRDGTTPGRHCCPGCRVDTSGYFRVIRVQSLRWRGTCHRCVQEAPLLIVAAVKHPTRGDVPVGLLTTAVVLRRGQRGRVACATGWTSPGSRFSDLFGYHMRCSLQPRSQEGSGSNETKGPTVSRTRHTAVSPFG